MSLCPLRFLFFRQLDWGESPLHRPERADGSGEGPPVFLLSASWEIGGCLLRLIHCSLFLREVLGCWSYWGLGGPAPRGHSIGGASSSVAFMRNCSISKLLEEATWRLNSVFSSFYFEDMRYVLWDLSPWFLLWQQVVLLIPPSCCFWFHICCWFVCIYYLS